MGLCFGVDLKEAKKSNSSLRLKGEVGGFPCGGAPTSIGAERNGYHKRREAQQRSRILELMRSSVQSNKEGEKQGRLIFLYEGGHCEAWVRWEDAGILTGRLARQLRAGVEDRLA